MNALRPIVHVVDDDEQMLATVKVVLEQAGLGVRCYSSAEEFLDRFRPTEGSAECVLTDNRMPGLSGVGLQESLAKSGVNIPIVIMTGFPSVSLAVQALKSGAVDFLEKPFHGQVLLERIQIALDNHARTLRQHADSDELREAMATLTAREREVMELLVAANSTKQTASRLGISAKTVAKHRAKVLEKLHVDNVVELCRLFHPDTFPSDS